MSSDHRSEVIFRVPTPDDGLPVWEMVDKDRRLDTNSPYYYTMWFRDFAQESLVATIDEEVVGFLNGYRRPEAPDTYVVWQEAVKPRHGVPDLGVNLFKHAAEQQIAKGANFVEATVSANNKPIIMVLRRFAKARSAKIENSVLFPASYFPEEHHDEILYRIGPLAPES
ncbi:L-2,4-diaminobutyric acid acetyltransferase [Saccharopolyspora lacisalsi]|uniref:L-2,4-diaminobutyric acid acetyltransferase n=1 Tax=Halosaccharopolyspora lacisalsi TaxID=1000566 RepID=A0A839DR40_9PSEU|nr:GNAT family N-acetyltransferase [Halosaccharopolyspora lacisalsi]MBA8823984.1 L-2,4-diaminobutyric acid acetyltransferase [Halosaccharopolyspora lacisalsi]